jgi:hypothetical protein
MNRSAQLELSLFTQAQSCETRFIPTRALSRHHSYQALLKKLVYVRRFFPELDGKPIRIGLTRAASGMAVPGGKELWLNPAQISYHTIAHELVHLLQGENNIPSGERSCDLFSLARHWTLNDTEPYYLKIPRSFLDETGKIPPEKAKIIYSTAMIGLKQRELGLRNYIIFFERTLADIAVNHSPRVRWNSK